MLVRAADLADQHLNPTGHGAEQMGCLGISLLCPLVESLKFGEASASRGNPEPSLERSRKV